MKARFGSLISRCIALFGAAILLIGTSHGEEVKKSFLELARDAHATASQKHTIAMILKATGEKSAEAALKKIESDAALVCYGGEISDLTPLAGFTDLETLVIYNNRVSDLAPLAGLTKLKTLRLELNAIRDIGPLSSLKNLESLQITNNAISDLGPLSGLSKLRTLWISDNKITSIAPLAGLKELKDLYLSGNPIADFEPLAKLSVSDLRLQNCGLSDISSLRHFNQDIEAGITLDLSKNHITDVAPLGELHQVFNLDLSDNRIADISPLKNRELGNLELANNRITKVASLAGLPALGSVDVKNNPIEDYDALAALARSRPAIEIVADKGFEEALRRSVPAKKELEGSPLLGTWLSDPVKTTEFGTFQIEMIFEGNGLLTRRMRYAGEVADSTSQDSTALAPQRTSYRLEGKVLVIDGGEVEKSEYAIRGDTLTLRGERGAIRFQRKKVGK